MKILTLDNIKSYKGEINKMLSNKIASPITKGNKNDILVTNADGTTDWRGIIDGSVQGNIPKENGVYIKCWNGTDFEYIASDDFVISGNKEPIGITVIRSSIKFTVALYNATNSTRGNGEKLLSFGNKGLFSTERINSGRVNEGFTSISGIESTKEFLKLAYAEDYSDPDTVFIDNISEHGYMPAVGSCYIYTTAGTKRGDWFLPTYPEISAILGSINNINNALQRVGGEIINEDDQFWTSSLRSKSPSEIEMVEEICTFTLDDSEDIPDRWNEHLVRPFSLP